MMSTRVFLPFFLLFYYFSVQAQGLYFPPKTGNEWESIDPAELGFCAERIDSLYTFLDQHYTKSFILLKDGKIVLEKYFGNYTQESIWYWASAGKSLTAFLVGQAAEEGLVDIHAPTSTYLGTGWTMAPPDKEVMITPWHQLTMTSGLDDTFIPTPDQPDPNTCTDPECLNYLADAGTRWAYHTGAYRLLQDVIAAASGMTINQFTKTHMLDRTGMTGLWISDVMYGRARDMARYGLLTLAGGIWDGDTLLHDQQYFYDMTHRSQELNKSYGYLWWLNGQESFMVPALQIVFPGKLIPNAPDDMIAALGKNDQKIHVVPSKGWVVVRQGDASGGVGGAVPIGFDNEIWAYLNQLDCGATAATEPDGLQLSISPNPAASGWWLYSDAPLTRVEMYDLRGNRVFVSQGAVSSPYRVEGTSLPAGVYYLKAISGVRFSVRKVVKAN
ncbi:MAG: serine hydrolase [Saprospiraceae bacterium]|nr:serine hydrolase [Saprospiraceae bacterium]